jgi:pimeloyl-ACP methyl ester carboxylesterase
LRVDDVDLAVRESGAGAPFLWGHGLLCSMDQEDAGGLIDWTAFAPDLRLIRYDARGHGRSEATLDPKGYRWKRLARDLWALADAVGAERPALGGVSMGCATALHAAVAAPERVRALVLVGPPTAWHTRPRQARFYRFSARLVDRFGLGPFRCLGALTSLGVRDPTLARMQRSVMQELRRADRRAVAAALRGAAESDLPAGRALRSLQMPALVLAWRGDPTHPLSTAKRLSELIPAAELCVAGSGEEMRAWPERIRAFLAAADGKPSPVAGRPRASGSKRPRAAGRTRPAETRRGRAGGA